MNFGHQPGKFQFEGAYISYLGSRTMMGSWPRAGISLLFRSAVVIRREEVLMQGWQPTNSLCSTSSSISSCTRFSLSFISPRMLKEPGVMSRNCSIYSPLAKDRREDPICLDSSLVLKGLSPGMSRI